MAALTMEECVGTGSPGRLIRQIYKLMLSGIAFRFAQGSLSFSQWLILKLVQDDLVATASDLTRDMSMTSGAVTRLVDSLEMRGLLVRQRVSPDRRVVTLELTKLGRESVTQFAPTIQAAWNDLLHDFSMAEVKEFVRLLMKLLEALERTVPLEASFLMRS